MLSALASGQIVREPKHGTSTNGTRWANTTIRCSTGTDKEGASLTSFISVVCFGDVADRLAKLDKGDGISVQGSLKQTEFEKDGTVRHGLEIMAQALLSPYQVRAKRGDDGKAANTTRVSHSGREQNQAYAEFAKRAAAPAHDDFGDTEIPF
jgi:single-stranded DNA-binding protein